MIRVVLLSCKFKVLGKKTMLARSFLAEGHKKTPGQNMDGCFLLF